MEKLKGILKYLVKIISYTLLTILIVCGLSLLFVFVTSKVAQSKKADPPINLFTIISPSMTPNIKVYDVVVAIKTKPSKIKIGDVITFHSDNPDRNGITITHRVAQIVQNGNEFYYKTKGDANPEIDGEVIFQGRIVGKVYFKIPQLGRVQFFLGSKGGWIIAILIPALAIISYDIYKIIKLIIIKQKIIAYQKQEDKPGVDTNIGTTADIYEGETNNNGEFPLNLNEVSNKVDNPPVEKEEEKIVLEEETTEISYNAKDIVKTNEDVSQENLNESTVIEEIIYIPETHDDE